MSTSMNPSSSTVSGGRNGGSRRREKQRGLPKFCRCGEEATIKTSGTAKNPGRLFYCCPNGSEGDKYHLFTWTNLTGCGRGGGFKVLGFRSRSGGVGGQS
uniref:GRF-type domain-containing protein n=1 Tax=Brassica campestris TaxID=3711 RepID=A0A3P6DBP2_BRACM|nr:unnamed protein product [Brassica rapa]